MKTTKARQAARGQECTLRIAGYGGCSGTDTTVLAHAPCRDDGKGFKSPDWWGAYACYSCHEIIDRRSDYQRWLTCEQQCEAWLRGIYETQKIQRAMEKPDE